MEFKGSRISTEKSYKIVNNSTTLRFVQTQPTQLSPFWGILANDVERLNCQFYASFRRSKVHISSIRVNHASSDFQNFALRDVNVSFRVGL